MAGTSMAAPHVSGILALMVAANPAITNAHRLDLLASAAKAFSGACPTSACGAGIAQAPAAVAAAAAAPVELTIDDPVVTGTAQVGATLTAGVSASRSGTRTSWQWLRSGAPISGATGSSYVPTAADIGATLAVRSKTGYLGASATRSSAATGVVAPGTFRQGRVPSISGKYKVRHKLTASVGVWSPTSTRTTYQWLRNGKKISRATSSHYKLAKKDKRKKISVKVTVSRPGYASQTSTSASHNVR
jgi:serine protease